MVPTNKKDIFQLSNDFLTNLKDKIYYTNTSKYYFRIKDNIIKNQKNKRKIYMEIEQKPKNSMFIANDNNFNYPIKFTAKYNHLGEKIIIAEYNPKIYNLNIPNERGDNITRSCYLGRIDNSIAKNSNVFIPTEISYLQEIESDNIFNSKYSIVKKQDIKPSFKIEYNLDTKQIKNNIKMCCLSQDTDEKMMLLLLNDNNINIYKLNNIEKKEDAFFNSSLASGSWGENIYKLESIANTRDKQIIFNESSNRYIQTIKAIETIIPELEHLFFKKKNYSRIKTQKKERK